MLPCHMKLDMVMDAEGVFARACDVRRAYPAKPTAWGARFLRGACKLVFDDAKGRGRHMVWQRPR